MPMLPQIWNNSAAQASLAPVASSPEYVIPLWWYSGSYASNTITATSGGVVLVAKGGTIRTPNGACSLHTLNANWTTNTKFAFETSLWINGGTAYAALYDITSSTVVSASQLSTANTTAAVYRSGQFTLTPGHVYGVTVWGNGGSLTPYLTDASLIVFPQ